MTNTSSIDALESLSDNITCVDSCLQCFEDNYGEMTGLYKKKMKYLFQTIILSFPIRNPDYYKYISDNNKGSMGGLVT